MKRILTALLALMMMISLVACSSKPENTDAVADDGVVSVEETNENEEQTTSEAEFNWVECENASQVYEETGTILVNFLADRATYRYATHNETEKLVEARFTDLNTGLEWQLREYRGGFGQYLTREQATSETGEAVPFAEDNCGQPISVTLPGAETANETLYRVLEDGRYQFIMINNFDGSWMIWMTVVDTPEMPELPL